MAELDRKSGMSYDSYIDEKKVRRMPETATLSSKFQISIPKAIRSAQHWEAGLMFAFIPKGKGVLLVPVPQRDELKGIAQGAQASDYRDRVDRF
jgi:AbrB family looped-hinge helix DNA binding protein